ncbi:MAG: response regulator transcription factor [Nitrosomonadales bacterium]|nr:response regulator transcription factor [Nitrosomonadales bacterium]
MPHNAAVKARILIVDDHPIVRQGMAMLINREPDMQACCDAGDIQQAVQANRKCPHDLATLDLSLVGVSGLELLKRFRFEFPELPILIISMHDEAVYAEPALRAGARGYLMKQVATDTMLRAIRQILRGEIYVSDSMNARMLQRMMQGSNENSPVSCLTATEFEVLHLIGLGLGTSEIAEKLVRSVKTIESHRANIKRKLNLNTSTQLTHFAIKLVSPTGGVADGGLAEVIE